MSTISLSTQLSLAVTGKYTSPDTAWGDANKQLSKSILDALTHGTGTDQANMLYTAAGTISSSSHVDISIGDGGVNDVYGRAVSLERLCLLLILNKNTTAGQTLLVGGNGPATPITAFMADPSDIVVVGPNGALLLWSPMDGYEIGVAVGETDLRLAAGGAYAVAYELLAIGRQTI